MRDEESRQRLACVIAFLLGALWVIVWAVVFWLATR